MGHSPGSSRAAECNAVTSCSLGGRTRIGKREVEGLIYKAAALYWGQARFITDHLDIVDKIYPYSPDRHVSKEERMGRRDRRGRELAGAQCWFHISSVLILVMNVDLLWLSLIADCYRRLFYVYFFYKKLFGSSSNSRLTKEAIWVLWISGQLKH